MLLTILVCVIYQMLVTKWMKSALFSIIDITEDKLCHLFNDKASQLEMIAHFQCYQRSLFDLTHPYHFLHNWFQLLAQNELKTIQSTSENRSRSVTFENDYWEFQSVTFWASDYFPSHVCKVIFSILSTYSSNINEHDDKITFFMLKLK